MIHDRELTPEDEAELRKLVQKRTRLLECRHRIEHAALLRLVSVILGEPAGSDAANTYLAGYLHDDDSYATIIAEIRRCEERANEIEPPFSKAEIIDRIVEDFANEIDAHC